MIKDTKTDSKWYGTTIRIQNESCVCCGINELNFYNALQKEYIAKYHDLSETNWNNLIAQAIVASCERPDSRVVFIGIPVKVGGHSQYNMEFYGRLLDTLRTFGFVELCKPYKNGNSQNMIIVLAGQMP